MKKMGERGEEERGAIQDDLDHDQEIREEDDREEKERKESRENPLGFTREDQISANAGIGIIYKKGDKWGFEAWPWEGDLQDIVEANFIKSDQKVDKSILDAQEVGRTGVGAYGYKEIDGVPTILLTERWWQERNENNSLISVSEKRTPEGWVKE